MAVEFKLPDLGENVESADIVDVMVAPGDIIAKDETVLEAETDKAVIEIPSTVAGTVTAIHVQKGQTVKVGDVILVVDESTAAATAAPATPAPASETAPPAAADAEPTPAAAPQPAAAPAAETPSAATAAPAPTRSADRPPVAAAPSVRQFAREIGVNIQEVAGTGPGGRISIEDVKLHARTRVATGTLASPAKSTTKEMSKIRKVTAAHMAKCWAEIPHVTLNGKADITDLEAIRQRYKKHAEKAGGRLTVTAIFVKFVAESLKKYPALNASIDPEQSQIRYHHFYSIGVAVDTDRGLVVPVIHDADTKSIFEIAKELGEVSSKARAGKLTPDDMSGGTFTVTNLGSIGVDYFTPIVNHPEVAILGMGRAAYDAVLVDGQLQPRLRVPLSLSFDHRLIDGGQGARFLQSLIAASENPLTMFFESS